MSKLQAKIEEAAAHFARKVVEIVGQMTVDELAGFLRTGERTERRASGAPKRPVPRVETPKQRDARKIQGSYIGLLRKFPPKEKLIYKRIARQSGVAEAVLAMKKKLGRA